MVVLSHSAPRAFSKTYKVPRRPYESARLDAELKVGHIFDVAKKDQQGQKGRNEMRHTGGIAC